MTQDVTTISKPMHIPKLILMVSNVRQLAEDVMEGPHETKRRLGRQ